ncbi:MAG: hypothetical protein DMG96_17450 [Acidobacteria bacterium]|nr:MAG: hypothetical protein DMG96_17450 [Acidobacteriota bacterium]
MPFETNPWFLVITSWFLGRRPADYNGNMARGWESKSVEQQQEEATSRKENRKLPLTTEQIAEEQRRQSIELSRQRILQQLQIACNPRHRAMLERALADLDAQLGGTRRVTRR